MMNGSKWFVIDLDCTAACKFCPCSKFSTILNIICSVINESSSITAPCWWPVKATNIDPTSIAAPVKTVNVQNPNQCQALCLLAVLQPLCRAYGIDLIANFWSCIWEIRPVPKSMLVTETVPQKARNFKYHIFRNSCTVMQ
jgi:hypothetical protein